MIEINKISFKGYKVFSDNDHSLSDLKNVNIIIGRNNSGKSSLLDVIEELYECREKFKYPINELSIECPFIPQIAESIFQGYSGIGRWNLDLLKKESQDCVLKVDISKNNSLHVIPEQKFKDLGSHIQNSSGYISNQRKEYKFRRVAAERNIIPEKETDIVLKGNGEGSTNLIQAFINKNGFEESVIENDLLDALNKIMKPETEYENIRVQQINVNNESLWEVYLTEKGKTRIPLSQMGSGLKTIILVLLNLLVVPKLNQYNSKQIVYGFEELENNLHPALQRRLFDYIYNFAYENKVMVFITTHSHIAINTFYDRPNASIYHIIRENNDAVIKRIDNFMDKAEVLNDLEIKASDLLQSNGIIWVEGPSDRIYIKRWMEIFTENKYIEGQHYQFLYYGGRLLSHYSTQEYDGLISILTTNRNAAIIIDSDKRNRGASINDTKKRIVKEFENLGMFSWVTKGKEIENYISCASIREMMDKNIKKELGQYDLFSDYINSYFKNFVGRKVEFAKRIIPHISEDNSSDVLDLKKQISKLYREIEKWNYVN